MSNVGVLNGTLQEFRLVELLQVMGLSASTGALHINAADGRTGLVYIVQGMISSCVELDTEALTLGSVLQQLGLATAEQIDHVYVLQTQDPLGKRIGERLIDEGTLSPDDLARALRTQAIWTLRELALWREGNYEFHPGEQMPMDDGGQRMDTSHAMMQLITFESEWAPLEAVLPQGMRTRVRMAPQPPENHPLRFHASAWRIIALANTRGSVRRIATALRMPELEVAQMIGSLINEGLLVAAGSEGGPGLPEQAARLSFKDFELFTLIVALEHEWLKQKTPADRLIALAGFINTTLRKLEESCEVKGLRLSPSTLTSLLQREHVTGLDGYTFRYTENTLDVDHFAAYARQMFTNSARGSMGAGKVFYDMAMDALLRVLASAFTAINTRIDSPIHRKENQDAWEALFMTFTDSSPVT